MRRSSSIREELEAFKHCVVRQVARRNGPAADALFTIAAGTRDEWTLAEWQDVLASLDSCEETVEDWLAIWEI